MPPAPSSTAQLPSTAFVGCTKISRLPRLISPNRTTPSISEIVAGSFGRRASNSSATRGRPPVMSRVLYASRPIFAIVVPGVDLLSVLDDELRADRDDEVADRFSFPPFVLPDLDVRVELLLAVFDDDALTETGELVELLGHRLVLDDVDEPDRRPRRRR